VGDRYGFALRIGRRVAAGGALERVLPAVDRELHGREPRGAAAGVAVLSPRRAGARGQLDHGPVRSLGRGQETRRRDGQRDGDPEQDQTDQAEDSADEGEEPSVVHGRSLPIPVQMLQGFQEAGESRQICAGSAPYGRPRRPGTSVCFPACPSRATLLDCMPILSKMLNGKTEYDRLLSQELRAGSACHEAELNFTTRQTTGDYEIRLR